MTEYDIKLSKEQMVALFSNNDAMAQMMTEAVNQVLEAQMDEHLGAARHEQTETRAGYRNGYRPRQLYTRIGKLSLRVPQTRDGSFSTDIFERYQRSEQAFALALIEMYQQGVSTRKVEHITQALCGTSVSKSLVSDLCSRLDLKVSYWRDRLLNEKRYPFLILDARYCKVRQDHRIVSNGVLIAHGINEDGEREILGIWMADSETEASWSRVFADLKERGLSGVDLIVSDAHQGLVKAAHSQFPGSQWQRCQTHFIRNVLGECSRRYRKEMAESLKLIFAAQDHDTARELARRFIQQYQAKASKSVDCFESGFEDALSVLSLPTRYRKRLRTSNMAERINEEIKRRDRVIRIYPNPEAAERLIGALLADWHEQWVTGVKYFDMTDYWDYRKQLEEDKSASTVAQFKPVKQIQK